LPYEVKEFPAVGEEQVRYAPLRRRSSTQMQKISDNYYKLHVMLISFMHFVCCVLVVTNRVTPDMKYQVCVLPKLSAIFKCSSNGVCVMSTGTVCVSCHMSTRQCSEYRCEPFAWLVYKGSLDVLGIPSLVRNTRIRR
jgi:hypothetical protein